MNTDPGARHSTLALDSRLWLLLSPALPIGGYSFSHGLETARAAGEVTDLESARCWILGLGQRVLPTLDLPVLARLLSLLLSREDHDGKAFQDWNEVLLASRESAELLTEDAAQGAALRRLLPSLDIAVPEALPTGDIALAASFAVVAAHWQIDRRQALAGFAWIWFEQQTAAAIKLVPLGHSEAQRILLQAADALPALVEQGLATADEDIGAGAPGLAMLSAQHEQANARQFRS